MEKIERGSPSSGKIPVAEWVYAQDYDSMRSDVRALVEDLKESSKLLHSINWAQGTIPFKARLLVDKAIAAVERHWEK